MFSCISLNNCYRHLSLYNKPYLNEANYAQISLSFIVILKQRNVLLLWLQSVLIEVVYPEIHIQRDQNIIKPCFYWKL